MKYIISTWKGDQHIESYEFNASNDEEAIERLISYLSPQDDGKQGNYSHELFNGDRFIHSINTITHF